MYVLLCMYVCIYSMYVCNVVYICCMYTLMSGGPIGYWFN